MNAMIETKVVSLRSILLDAKSGFAVGEREPGGVIQLRMNNVSVSGELDLSKPTRVPVSSKQQTEYSLKKGDVLFNNTNSPSLVGKSAYFPGYDEPVLYSNHFTRLRFDGTIVEPKYVAYWLTQKQQSGFFETRCKQWVNQASIGRDDLLLLEIPLPSLSVQNRIAAILDKADAIRRKRIDACELARESVRNFFLSQFGDPILNVKGFDSCPIAEVAKIVTGNTPSRDDPENYGDGIEWIKSDNINTPSHYLTQSSERLSEIGERKSRPVPAGSTLVTCIAGSPSCIGNAALADRRVACNQQINAVVPGERLIDRFLYAMILVLKPAIQQLSSKSMKGMVSKGRFETLPVIVPPLAEQKKFAAVFDQIVGMTAKMENAAEESGALFNSLVQQAFKGEL
jgi:type I restriction enzyme S subunit